MKGDIVTEVAEQIVDISYHDVIEECVYMTEGSDENWDYPDRWEQPDAQPVEITETNQRWVHCISMVNESGTWNKDTCCVKVNNSWNFTSLSQLLIDYHDQEILQYLMFGWPVDCNENIPLELGGVITREQLNLKRS